MFNICRTVCLFNCFCGNIWSNMLSLDHDMLAQLMGLLTVSVKGILWQLEEHFV